MSYELKSVACDKI